jgi:hypothetical protein
MELDLAMIRNLVTKSTDEELNAFLHSFVLSSMATTALQSMPELPRKAWLKALQHKHPDWFV